jgi:transposase
LALRAKVILECAQGKSNLEMAKQLGVCQHMVGKWRRRFIEDSLEGLVDAPRSGAPREISDEKVEEVVTKTLETTPPARTHWSSWLMAKEAGISQDSVRRIWQAFGLFFVRRIRQFAESDLRHRPHDRVDLGQPLVPATQHVPA